MKNAVRGFSFGSILPLLLVAVISVAAPTVYPTGTTIYDPVRAWSGYTIFIAPEDLGAVLIDMNGNTVKRWTGYHGGAGGPARVLPGGYVIASGPVRSQHQESNAVIQLDWDGNVVWKFDHAERIDSGDGSRMWSARQHHDWQREGMPAGYYSPEASPVIAGGKTLVVSHTNHVVNEVSDRMLEDDRLIEVSPDGEVLWEWHASEHIDEFGFSDDARAVIRSAPGFSAARGSFDWLHVNSATYVGPNRWYDAGDARFHPEHIVISSRGANFVAIIARDGSVAWRMGPDYLAVEATAGIGQVIGQHHPHIIPKGLPGAGNLLLFDNGGAAGYGFANPMAPGGANTLGRGSSRVLEIDPTTFEAVWSYSIPGRESYRFFSHYISSAQRLENGNTMITEGADGRLFEVNTDGEIVWEYVSPYFVQREVQANAVYRAYRLPYGWVPQLAVPTERAVVPPMLSEFRVP
jgi:hypothetical protein